MIGSAACKASSALPASPLAMASSTLRTELRNRERRALLTSVRRAMTRVAFWAEVVLAMPVSRPAGGRQPAYLSGVM